MVAIDRSVKGVLLIAFVVVFSALAVATVLTRRPARELSAPEAWAAFDKQEFDRAASLFAAALKERPRDPALHFGAASAARGSGNPRAALASLRTAIELDPDFPEAHAMLGQIAYERGDTDLAIRSLEKAAALRPRDRSIGELLDRWRRESSVHGSYLEKPAEHFRILYEGGTQHSIGDRVAQVLEREYPRIGRTLNSFPREPVTVILYSNREYHDITRSPSWSTGSYDGRIRVAIGGAVPSRELDRLVTHELVHAFVASAASRRIPTWLNEGLATYLEGSDASWTGPVLHNAATIVPLDALIQGFNGLDEQTALVAYAESRVAAEILCSQLGANIGAFLQMVGDGRSVDDALLEFQVQPNAFHAEWRRRVGLR
jgi:tetratricopeptide (TPR) repeat protein